MSISLNNHIHQLTQEQVKEKAQKAEEQINSWNGRLVGDPLTMVQQQTIKTVFDYFLLSSKKQTIYDSYSQPCGEGYPRRRIYSGDLKDFTRGKTSPEKIENLKKSLFEPEQLDQAPEQVSKELEIFKQIVRNPASYANLLGIDPQDSAQVFAARKFISALLDTPYYHYKLTEIHARYRKKMTCNQRGEGFGKPISQKNLLLMENDPIQKQLEGKSNRTCLDHVLSQTFFKTPQSKQETIYSDGKGNTRKETIVYGPNREEARKIIETALTNLQQNEHLDILIQVLGILVRKENVKFLFGGSTFGAHDLGESYGVGANIFNSTEGFYKPGGNSVICSSLIHPMDNSLRINTLGTFVHESLHMIFDKIVKNSSDPTQAGSEEEKLLDQALEKDRQHRKKLLENKEQLSSDQQSIWYTLVDVLEQEESYFPGGFDENNFNHLHTMRLEAIVRPLEQIAQGASPKDLEAVCPHLWKFYNEHSKKLLEKFIAENAHFISTSPHSQPQSIEEGIQITEKQEIAETQPEEPSREQIGQEHIEQQTPSAPIEQPALPQEETAKARPSVEALKPVKTSFFSKCGHVLAKIFQAIFYPFHCIKRFFQNLFWIKQTQIND